MNEEWAKVIAALSQNLARLAEAVILQEKQIIQLRADVERQRYSDVPIH